MDKLYKGDFDAIASTKIALADVIIVLSALDNVGCSLEHSTTELEEAGTSAAAFVLSIAQTDLQMVFLISLSAGQNPNRVRAETLAHQNGCKSERTQTVHANIARLLSSRNSMHAWAR